MKRHAHIASALLVSCGVHVLSLACAVLCLFRDNTALPPVFAQGDAAVLVTMVAAPAAVAPEPKVPAPPLPAPPRIVSIVPPAPPPPPEPEPEPVAAMPDPPEPEASPALALNPPPPAAEPSAAAPEPLPAPAAPEAQSHVPAPAGAATGAQAPTADAPPQAAAGQSGVESAVAYRTDVRPEYPMSARMRGEEGVVTVLATIDAAGRAQSVALEKSSGFTALDRAALAASRRANFAASGGPAVAGSRILLTFRFKLVDS